nr:AraC family transcriptional regulator [Oribacterium sp. oral taxon 102]
MSRLSEEKETAVKRELLETLKAITEEERRILNGSGIDRSFYNLDLSTVIDAKKLLREGRLIDLRPHTRFIDFPKHSHNYVELVYMFRGQTTHFINGTEVILHSGELLFLSPGATQEIRAAGAEDLAVNFIILPEFFDKSLDMIGGESSLIRDFLIDCLRTGRQNAGYLHFHVADVLPVQNLMENLIWMLRYDTPNRRRLDATTMGLLFLHLLRFTDKLELGTAHTEQELLLSVFRFLEENYRDGELSALSRTLRLPLCQLSRSIKAGTGKNFTELLQEKRLSRAAYLLRSTDLSITDISLDVGYHNFSYFYRLFRRRFGCSPRRYRLTVK